MERLDYARAGVDIALAQRIKQAIAKKASPTLTENVLAGPGVFGGLFELKGYREPVLVSSVDGVGTKIKIAIALGRHHSIGQDIVNHCVNDILTTGADPLFFLDYIAMPRLDQRVIEELIDGMAEALRKACCALIGGETAELPGLYTEGDYDLAGFITGVVEKDKIITGRDIVAGDIILGLPSSGLHTNGYSLVRRIFGTSRGALEKYYPELGTTLGEALLVPHRSYYSELKGVLGKIKGLAHITGGGFAGNIPRILPPGLTFSLNHRWNVPRIFRLIQEQGNIDGEEMYHVFNMGIGMAVIVSRDKLEELRASLKEALEIGEVIKDEGYSERP